MTDMQAGAGMDRMVAKAAYLAEYAHAGQVRKYTAQPYITHPLRVAGAVSMLYGSTHEMIAAAWLHDVIEDTAYGADQIEDMCGADVAALVLELTNEKHPDLPRSARKAIQRDKMAQASREAKFIKCCDRLDNLRDLPCNEFRKMYAAESVLLCDAMTRGDYILSHHWVFDALRLTASEMAEQALRADAGEATSDA